ncbi:AsnC family transcriptional regulator, partial [Nocardia cyriacigeorgica]
MDSLDRAIIAELEADGRLTNVELAGRVGRTARPKPARTSAPTSARTGR